jgi:hypothetical protein
VPLVHFSKVFAVEDGKFKKITADPSGGTTTFASSIDVPGIKSVKIEGDVEIKRLRGDNTLLDVMAILQNVKPTFNWAKEQLDMRAAMVGGTVTDSGTTPNQVAKWALDRTGQMSPFQFEAKTPTSGVDFIGGDAVILLYKCIAAGFPPLGLPEEDYHLTELACEAFPRLSDGKWIDVSFRETAAALT